jgi:hypothetical protein
MSRFSLRMALVACVLTVLSLAPVAQAGIAGHVWIENPTDYRIHVWAEPGQGTPVDLGWVEPHVTTGWLNGTVNDCWTDRGSPPPTTQLHAESEDGAHAWEQSVPEDRDNYTWVLDTSGGNMIR